MQKLMSYGLSLSLVLLSFSGALAADALQCKNDIATNTGAYWRIKLTHQFPRTHSQGQNGICYMYSLMSTVSAGLYRKRTNDHRLNTPSNNAFNKDFEYSPELTLLLMAKLDRNFLIEKLEAAKDRSAKNAQYVGLFDTDYASSVFLILQKNPEALVSVDIWEKVTWLSTASQYIYDEFTKVNDLGGDFVLSRVQTKIDRALLKIIAVMEKSPALSASIQTLHRNGFTWDLKRRELNFSRNASRSLPLRISSYTPGSGHEAGCQAMIDSIFGALCKGIPAMVSTAKKLPGQDFESRHSSVVVGTIPYGKGKIHDGTDLLIRDSAWPTAESDQFNPHRGFVGFPLKKACTTVISNFHLYSAQFILAPGEEI